MTQATRVRLDVHRSASLDGEWDFYPGDRKPSELDDAALETIRVPGLWEAKGHLDLDGPAWYRRRFVLDDVGGHWTLRFGGVMDFAEVYLNDKLLGFHESPFTPFELDATEALVQGENVLCVRVNDPPLTDPEHMRMPHGKQGWGNRHFPSRPSLYMTYGGIWQPVTLHRHGPVVLRDVFVNGDPDDLVVTVEARNVGTTDERTRVGFRTASRVREVELELAPGERRTLEGRFGRIDGERWRPESPALHLALVDALVEGEVSDTQTIRYGLRTVRVDGDRILVNDEPYRMKSVLVQGFRAEELYAEGPREAILEEVLAAKDMGFNTVRLHIKAFDPTYLDVCDEVGMLVHCDIPVAEPLEYDEMRDDSLLAQRCVVAAQEQVRRDRNHPSIVLWSAMNEICDMRKEMRLTEGYELFVRTVTAAVEEADPTRPVIENDWIEPDPGRVFVSPILTAHWYGRLHADYFDKLERQSRRWAGTGRPLYISEYGDWGLPEMPEMAEPPFWDTREVYAAGLARTLWPGTVGRFIRETQRYQGLSDRLQTEIFRRHDHIGGYCLTELTDVPHELNGVLDLHRRPKPLAVAEIRRANQVVLPMLELESLVVACGGLVRAPLHVSNDGPPLADVEVEARFGDTLGARSLAELAAVDASGLSDAAAGARFEHAATGVRVGELPAYRAAQVGEVELVAPEVPGSHDLVLRLRSGGQMVAENRYPIHVVARPQAPPAVRLLGGGRTADALHAVGCEPSGRGPVVVAEGALDAELGRELGERLARGDTALVLAQAFDTTLHYPYGVRLKPVQTQWGSSVFHFTTDESPLASLPRQQVLVAEDSTVQARSVVIGVDGQLFPETPVVIAYKPDPRAFTGTIIGSHRVGRGRLVFCQYRLSDRAASGDAAAQAILADLLRWADAPSPSLQRERITKEDGRSLIYYSHGKDTT